MADLPAGWNRHLRGEHVPKRISFYQEIAIIFGNLMRSWEKNLLDVVLGAGTPQEDPNIMSSHVA